MDDRTSGLRKTLLHIDSDDRNIVTHTDTETFKIKIIPPLLNIRFLQIINMELPFTFYAINAGINDTIYFKGISLADQTAVISQGTYTITDFLAEVKTKMDAVGDGVYTVTRNKQTRKLTIATSGTYELTTTTTTQAIWKIMGFTTNTDNTGAATYTANNVYNMTGDQFVYLQSSMAENLKDDIIVSTGLRNVIAKIPVKVAFGSTIFYEPPVPIVFEFKTLIFSDIQFNLRNKDFSLLELNNSDWSMTFILFSEEKLLPPPFATQTKEEKEELKQTAREIR